MGGIRDHGEFERPLSLFFSLFVDTDVDFFWRAQLAVDVADDNLVESMRSPVKLLQVHTHGLDLSFLDVGA